MQYDVLPPPKITTQTSNGDAAVTSTYSGGTEKKGSTKTPPYLQKPGVVGMVAQKKETMVVFNPAPLVT